MLRSLVNSLSLTLRSSAVQNRVSAAFVTSAQRFSHGEEEPPEQMDARYVAYFKNPDIDSWLLRRGMQEIHAKDAVPEPMIIIEALNACRRVNDIALAIRFLEAVQYKCGKKKNEIWPYLHQEISPTLKELGIPTPEEIGYDKPELYLKHPDEV